MHHDRCVSLSVGPLPRQLQDTQEGITWIRGVVVVRPVGNLELPHLALILLGNKHIWIEMTFASPDNISFRGLLFVNIYDMNRQLHPHRIIPSIAATFDIG